MKMYLDIRQLTHRIFIPLISITLLFSCGRDKRYEVIDGQLKLEYYTAKDSIHVVYGGPEMQLQLVPQQVKKIGNGEKYLIVERLKTVGMDSSYSIYYIINKDLLKNPDPQSTEKLIYKLLDSATFLETKRQLGIEKLRFDKEL